MIDYMRVNYVRMIMFFNSDNRYIKMNSACFRWHSNKNIRSIFPLIYQSIENKKCYFFIVKILLKHKMPLFVSVDNCFFGVPITPQTGIILIIMKVILLTTQSCLGNYALTILKKMVQYST